jgi:hypothetical protein
MLTYWIALNAAKIMLERKRLNRLSYAPVQEVLKKGTDRKAVFCG